MLMTVLCNLTAACYADEFDSSAVADSACLTSIHATSVTPWQCSLSLLTTWQQHLQLKVAETVPMSAPP